MEKLPCGECPQSQQVDLEEVVLHVHVWHASGLVEDLQRALLLVQVVALLFHLVSCANSTIRSSRWKESGTGRRCSGELLNTSSNRLRPFSLPNSVGSKCRTTDLALPDSLCHIFGAASFFSVSFKLASYHLQLVTKLSNSLGSPLHVGTSLVSCGMTKSTAATSASKATKAQDAPGRCSAYHAIPHSQRIPT